MSRFKHTSAVVLLTLLSVVIGMSSFSLPYFEFEYGYEDEDGWVHYSQTIFHPSYYDNRYGMSDYSGNYAEVGALFSIVWLLVWAWAIAAIAYIYRVMNVGESEYKWHQGGFVAGWVIAVLALLPPLVFAALMVGSMFPDWVGPLPYDGFWGAREYDSWGPMVGWMLLALGSALQVLAVLVRNIPSIVRWVRGPDEAPAEVAATGDLPLR